MLNNIEIIIFLLLLFMGVPGLCRKLGRPALGYPVFVLIGLFIASFVSEGVRTMLTEAGQVGFVLLLFEVGLEIDLPRFREMLEPLRRVVLLVTVQYPLLLALAFMAGLGVTESFIATAALTACSLSMAYGAWKGYPLHHATTRAQLLLMMVLMELLSVVLLAVETVVLNSGMSWAVPVKLVGIGVTVVLVARFIPQLTRLFQKVLEKTTHWRVHFLVLLVLAICALGERFGLSAAKTAFVLGLFMSRIEHAGLGLEEYMAPISRRFLIPIFFVALGMQIPWTMLFTGTGMMALGTAGLMIGFREILHRRWLLIGGDRNTHLLLVPNLTIVALAANSLLLHKTDIIVVSWLLMTGLFMTVFSLFFLPPAKGEEPRPPDEALA